jgi:uncharacterized membrane protein
MASLREGKAIGAAASVLLLLGFGASPVNLAALLLGLILLLVSAKYISEQTLDMIYTNIMWAVACLIFGAIVGFLVVFNGLESAVRLGSGTVDWSVLTASLVAGLVVVWVFFILAAILIRRSYHAIAQSLRVDLFRTAAALFLAGAVFIIVVGLGFILIFAAIGVQLAAFLSLPDQPPPKTLTDPWGKPVSPSSLPQPLKKA